MLKIGGTTDLNKLSSVNVSSRNEVEPVPAKKGNMINRTAEGRNENESYNNYPPLIVREMSVNR